MTNPSAHRPPHRLHNVVTLCLGVALLLGAALLPAPVHAQPPGPTATPVLPPVIPTNVPPVVEEETGPPPDVVYPSAEEAADAQGTVVQIQPSKDVYILYAQPNFNTAGSDNLKVGWSQGEWAMRSLIKFDLNNVPRNSQIYSARLFMYLDFALPPSDYPMQLNGAPITQGWNEGGSNGATWNNAAGIGGSQFSLGQVGTSPGWVSFNVTGQVQNWVNGQSNNGLMIIGDETPSLNRSRIFRSREWAGYAPYLLVDYQCDTLAPLTQMNGLPAFSAAVFTASWSGFDRAPSGCQPSGIHKHKVEYRVNGAPWINWKSTSSTSATFSNLAPNGSFVEFREWSDDNAGNVEPVPSTAQTATTIDSQPPIVTVNPLPTYTASSSFAVSWSAFDTLSGVANYTVRMQVNGGSWIEVLTNSTQTSYTVTGAQNGQVYGFEVAATDRVGNTDPWPGSPQTVTTIALFPQATMAPFNPNIVKPSTPTPTAFNAGWSGTTAAGVLTQFEVYYRYTDSNGVMGAWQLWSNFPANETSAPFPFAQLGLGDGIYDFEVTATNSLGETSPSTGNPEASMIVDLADKVQPLGYLPEVARFAR
jgi:hypothetical protein